MTAPVVVSRAQWEARPPKGPFTRMALPSPRLWLHHTAGTERGAAGMRSIQRLHQDTRDMLDVAYSFVFDPWTRTWFEARGPGVVGGHTKNDNSSSHALCVMGNFETIDPPDTIVADIADMVRHGHAQGWWPATLTGGHRDAPGASTACPGTRLYRLIPAINRLAVEAPREDDDMREGDQGLRVAAWQFRLSRIGYPAPVDGHFGSTTTTATKAFQTDLGLEADGVVTGAEWAFLLARLQADDLAAHNDPKHHPQWEAWREGMDKRYVQHGELKRLHNTLHP